MKLTIIRPDDCHLHVRSGELLGDVVGYTAAQFGRAIIMPNLMPPIATVAQAEVYREQIVSSLNESVNFTPLMTLYLTDNTSVDEIKQAAAHPDIYAAKLYPAGATTNSDAGVSHVDRIFPLLEAMQAVDLPLLVHGEATATEIDVFDREAVFIDKTLTVIRQRFPELRIVFEHITTQDAVDYVLAEDDKIAATITAHHLLLNRNHLLVGGIKPHNYCLPVLKRNTHQQALISAATSGNPKFFLGTDSAPHIQSAKESACGCAGCFTAIAAIEWYAEVFEQAGALDKLEGFASCFGADFYRLPRNSDTITLIKQPWQLPDNVTIGQQLAIPFQAGENLNWKLLG